MTSSFHLLPLLIGLAWALFDPVGQTIDSIHGILASRQVTCRQVIQGHLAQIEAYNPLINAILHLNPKALETADALDHWSVEARYAATLFCIPVLLKDNFNTCDMPTTAGSISLKDFRPRQDAPSVEKLRRAGAIILGKTNMHEFALEGLSVSSLGGQTRNPYDLRRTPGGSSGGSGAAIAASFAVLATGSDTINSIRSPASANGIYGLRPTTGLISRAGVIPVSHTQDAIGPIARTISDLALALQVLVGKESYDSHDNLTVYAQHHPLANYTNALIDLNMNGLRIGVLSTLFNDTKSEETDPVNLAMMNVISCMKNAGASIIDITNPSFDSTRILATLDVQSYEFEDSLNSFLELHPSSEYKSFHEIYKSGKFLPSCFNYAFGAAKKLSSSATRLKDHKGRLKGQKELKRSILSAFDKHTLDVMIFPHQKNLVVKVGSQGQSGRNGVMASMTGLPSLVVPIASFAASFASQQSLRDLHVRPNTQPPPPPARLPIGMELLGRPFMDHRLLQVAHALASLQPTHDAGPGLINRCFPGAGLETVPVVRPDLHMDESYFVVPDGFP